MPSVIANPVLAAWDLSLAASATVARSAVAGLSAEILARRPSWGGWSVDTIFEHLCVIDGLYETRLRDVIMAERARPEPRRGGTWRPTLWGRLLRWSVDPGNARPSKTPGAFQPGPIARAQVADAWLAQVERTRALMREADGLDLRRMKLSSPAAQFIQLNVGDAFAVNALHAERHMGQVLRTLADVVGTPAPR